MKIYKNPAMERRILETYDEVLELWDTPTAETDVHTFCGTTHVITCGREGSPPLVLFHGVGDDSALSWVFNAGELAKHFRIYAVDTMGGPGKSRPNENYVQGFDRLRWLDELFTGLELPRAFVAGVSSGAFIAQYYGTMRPEKITGMVCMSRTDITSSTGKHPIRRMLRVFMPAAAFPTDRNIVKLIKKLAGDHDAALTGNPVILAHYKCLLRGYNNMAMSCHANVSFSTEQLNSIKERALFLFGESDPLGDAESIRACLQKHQLQYRFFPGAKHLIHYEMAEEINQAIIAFCGRYTEEV